MVEEKEPSNGVSPKKVRILEILKIYLSFLKNYKILAGVILILVLVLELRHIAESYLFKVLVDKGSLFAAGTLLKEEFIRILWIIVTVFAGVVGLGFIIRWVEQHLVNVLESKLVIDLKKKYFNHLIDLDYGFHVGNKTGQLISRLGRGSDAMAELTEDLAYNIISVIFSFIVVMASLIYFDFLSAIVTFSIVVVFLGFGYFMQKIGQRSSVLANDAEDAEKGSISDIFTNVESIKYYGKENLVKRKFDKIINTTRNAFMRYKGYYRWLDSTNSVLIGVGTFFILLFPTLRFLEGEIDLGALVFIYTIYGTLSQPLYDFVYGLRDVYHSMINFHSLFEYGNIKRKVIDKPNAQKMKIKDGEVEFQNVTFNYGKRKIFENLNLKIPKNSKVALVGPSGSGKTTLVKLLYRFYDINSGKILIDGKDITGFKQDSLRSSMSIVPQECILFDDTIYNNILFSNPSATKEEVMQAIKFAQLDKVIGRFPQKEYTIVGERGVKLSGGEKQRVSIARAILANRRILILDEATSALDSETEFEIQKDLEKLMEGRTSIIIAHRLSTIMSADNIIILKNGEIVQQGKHSQLINQQGEYRKFWNLQKGAYLKEKEYRGKIEKKY